MQNARQNPERVKRVFSILVGVYGLLFLIAMTCTIVSLFSVNDLLSNATHVDGQVVALHYGAKGTRAPVVRFKTTTGETLELQSSIHSSLAPNVGDTVKVIYRTSNPRDWHIDDWIHLYFWTMMGSIFTLTWLLFLTSTKLIGDYQIRKLEVAGVNSTTKI